MSPLKLAELYTRKTAVYRLFAVDDQLLYVGVSNDPKVRVPMHRAKPWWPDVAATTVEWHPDRLTALLHEACAIDAESPRHNAYRPSPDLYHARQTAGGGPSRGPRLTFEQAADEVDVPVEWLRKGVARGRLPHSCAGPAGNHVWFAPDDIRDLHVIYDVVPRVFRSQRAAQRAAVLRPVRLKRCSHAAA